MISTSPPSSSGGDNKRQRRQVVMNRQIERLERRITAVTQTTNRYVAARLITFLMVFAGALAALILVSPTAAGLAILAMSPLFGGAVYLHRQAEKQKELYVGWHQIKQQQLARMRHDWANIPQPPFTATPDDRRQIEVDFDILGENGLLHLISTAVTSQGAQRLRRWLTQTEPDLAELSMRQAAVKEVVSASIFREKLILHGGGQKMPESEVNRRKLGRMVEASSDNAVDQLLTWAAAEPPKKPTLQFVVLLSFNCLVTAVLFLLGRLGIVPDTAYQFSILLYLFLSLSQSESIGRNIFAEAANVQDTLQKLMRVFEHLEGWSYKNMPHLKVICQPFLDVEKRPSQYLAAIQRVVAATSFRSNPFLWLAINLVVPWDYWFVYLFNNSKRELHETLPDWIDRWTQVEALASLANLAYLNPAYSFPHMSEERPDKEWLRAVQLGHPLIPFTERVRNDFNLTDSPQLVVITGSNMAGKSSFLRTVGLNLLLAYAGGPVDAYHFEARPFRLFSSIRLTDSVTDGISYFYAEVRRLRVLLDRLEQDHAWPMFVFIDEIFRGTNNRERLLGSREFIRHLHAAGANGLISTHDLELVQLADELDHVRNVHFRETVEGQTMHFDYQLQEGPCPTTNALKIMAAAGLPVPADTE